MKRCVRTWLWLAGSAGVMFGGSAIAQVATPAGTPGEGPKASVPGSSTVVEGGKPTVPDGVRAIYDIAYVENGHSLQKLDLYLPQAPSATPLPLVIWVHSGNWKKGDKQNCPAMGWAARGFAAASVNYRLTPEVGYREMLLDIKQAIVHLREHAADHNLDPTKFAIWGVSAGGHLAALAAVTHGDSAMEGLPKSQQRTEVQAAVVWFAPMDLTKFGAADQLAPDIEALVGGSLANKGPDLKAASPVTHVTKNAPPFLFFHGGKNTQVPPIQTELMANALKASGVEATAFMLAEQGHGFRPQQVFNEQVARVEYWLRKKFGLPTPENPGAPAK